MLSMKMNRNLRRTVFEGIALSKHHLRCIGHIQHQRQSGTLCKYRTPFDPQTSNMFRSVGSECSNMFRSVNAGISNMFRSVGAGIPDMFRSENSNTFNSVGAEISNTFRSVGCERSNPFRLAQIRLLRPGQSGSIVGCNIRVSRARNVLLHIKTDRCSERGLATCGTRLPIIYLFTKDGCTLCDEAKLILKPYMHRFILQEVDIELPENEDWYQKYKYDIPVFHMHEDFLFQHRVDLSILERALKQYETQNE